MSLKEHILANRVRILQLSLAHGASDVRLFGSVARGEDGPNSDVDLLVRMEEGRTLLDQGALVMDLRDLLGVSVDVVSEGALHGRFGERVKAEAVRL